MIRSANIFCFCFGFHSLSIKLLKIFGVQTVFVFFAFFILISLTKFPIGLFFSSKLIAQNFMVSISFLLNGYHYYEL